MKKLQDDPADVAEVQPKPKAEEGGSATRMAATAASAAQPDIKSGSVFAATLVA